MAKTMLAVLFLCLLPVYQSSASTPGLLGCTSRNGCNYPKLAEFNRKMMVALERGSAERVKSTDLFIGAELRTVPSGPDPLHHNGGPHKRPKASP